MATTWFEDGIRVGGPDDLDMIVALFDEAVDWLVARGQLGQWGDRHVADRPPAALERFAAFAAGGGLRVAECDGVAEGVLVLGDAFAHVEPPDRPERYVQLLLTSRARARTGVGARLVQRAAAEARAAGCAQLRVDCWAGAPALVAWYESVGFVRSGTFDVDGWVGQVFTMALQP